MKCEVCGEESGIIYATREHGLICCECERKMKNSEERKLKEYNDMLKMHKRYGIDV